WIESPCGSSSRCIRLSTPPYFGVSAGAEAAAAIATTVSPMTAHHRRLMDVSCPGENRAFPLRSGRQDDGLPRRLLVEELVGFVGLLELPAVGEEPLDVDLLIGDELGALGLSLLRE